MKKIYFITLLFYSSFLFSQSLDYNKMIATGTYTVQEIQTEAEAYFAIKGTGKGTGYKQYKRWEYQALREMDANGFLKSPTFYYKELQRYNSSLNKKNVQAKTNADTGNWQQLGPSTTNPTSNSSSGIGRITSVAFEPGQESHIIVGAETGGVWKTINGGATWTVLTDNMSNMDVYALAIDPNAATNYYWGSTNGTIFKSSDAGSTWSLLVSGIGAGQVNKILIDPTPSSTKMYCSTENGGLFKSTNSGASWSLIHPEATGYGYDFEFKPGDPNTVYASGTAVFKSTDGGANFTKLIAPTTIPNWTSEYVTGTINWKSAAKNIYQFGVTIITPKAGDGLGLFTKGTGSTNDATKLVTPAMNISSTTNPELKFSYALPNWGTDVDKLTVYYKTSAAGSWTQLATYTAAQTVWVDVTLPLPNKSAEYYIAFEGQSLNGGDITLDVVSVEDGGSVIFSDGFETATPNIFGTGAKMLAVSVNDPSVVFLVEASDTGTAYFKGLYKSTDSGSTFNKINHNGKNYFGRGVTADAVGDEQVGQAPRDMDIAISPNNINEVHIAGINPWRSLDGGVTFSPSAHWVGETATSNSIGYCHADVDMLEFVGTTLYAVTDGGIYKATNSGGSMSTTYYTDITAGLGIRQFYAFGVSQTNPVVTTGGSQDNGSSVLQANGIWRDWLGGDGMEGFVDKTNSSILYGTTQKGQLNKSIDGALTYSDITPEDDAFNKKVGNWVTPFEQDPSIVNKIYAGYDQVYTSPSGGDGDELGDNDWTTISQIFDQNLTNLKIAPSLNTTMYASYSDKLFKTTTAGSSGDWSEVTGVSGSINSIAIHPTNPNKVAVATTSSDKVYVTTNGGTTWTSYKYDLPDFSALALAWDNNTKDGLYLGMNYGVYYIDNTTGTSWKTFNNLLPNVKISELEVNYADNKLYAATYGRGLWSTDRYNTSTLSVDNAVELALETIVIYPNPAANEINLLWDNNESVTIRIFDSKGKLLHYSKGVSLLNNLKIDVSHYANGLYFVRINSNKGIITKKLVIK